MASMAGSVAGSGHSLGCFPSLLNSAHFALSECTRCSFRFAKYFPASSRSWITSRFCALCSSNYCKNATQAWKPALQHVPQEPGPPTGCDSDRLRRMGLPRSAEVIPHDLSSRPRLRNKFRAPQRRRIRALPALRTLNHIPPNPGNQNAGDYPFDCGRFWACSIVRKRKDW